MPGTFEIEQIYSDASANVQFVVIRDRGRNDCDSGEQSWAGETLKSSGGAGPAQIYVFPSNLPTCATSGRRILIGTQAFAALGVVTPDYVIPNRFIPTPNGTLDFANVSSVSYSALPSDGTTATLADGTRIRNLATNLAGQSASVTAPAFAIGYGSGGTWYNPATPGQGFFIEIVPSLNLMVFSWFTWSHGTTGDHDWLTGIGPITGDSAVVDLRRSSGGRFNDPAPVGGASVGSATVRFTDCNSGTVTFTRSDNGTSGTIPIQRLTTTPAACTSSAAE